MRRHKLAFRLVATLLAAILFPGTTLAQIVTTQENNSSNPVDHEEVEKLVSELEESIYRLEELSRVSDESLVVEYVKQGIQWMISDVEELDIHSGTKNSLLVKLDAASRKNDQALQFLLDGKGEQANNMLKTTSNLLDAFVNEVRAQIRGFKKKKIAEEDAKNLISQAQEIIEGIKEGAQWIIEEEIYVELIQQPRILAEIDKEIAELKEIIAELQALGVEIDVIYVEESPGILVIVVAGVKYVILPAAASALMAYGFIFLLEKYIGPVSWCCKLKIMAISAVAGAVGVPAMKVALIKLGLGLTTVKKALVIMGGTAGLRIIMLAVWKVIGKCEHPECIFYKPVSLVWHDKYGYTWTLQKTDSSVTGTVDVGGPVPWTVTGTMTQTDVHWHAVNPTYPEPWYYTWYFDYYGTLSADGTYASGNWTNYHGFSGTWWATQGTSNPSLSSYEYESEPAMAPRGEPEGEGKAKGKARIDNTVP